MTSDDGHLTEPTFHADQIGVLKDGEEITVWNRISVSEYHAVRATEIESHHHVVVGDGSTGEEPEYVTPKIRDQMRLLDIYPNVEVVDPTDHEVL